MRWLAIAVAGATIFLTPVASGARSPQRALGTVSVSVSGNGSVTSSPAGISCPSACSASFPDTTTVVLTAQPGSGATFAGWGGACSGTGTCRFGNTANNPSVSATFTTAASSPTVSLGDISVTEGDAGTSIATLTATVSPATSDVVTVHYATSDGSATSSDYVTTTGTLTFPSGASTANLIVPIRGDTVHEETESFFVDLSAPDHAVIGDGRGVVTIADNDAADTDGDGHAPPQDCNDADPAIHPDASEVTGNDVDENCDGIVAPFPSMDVGLESSWLVTGTFTRVSKLDVVRALAGSSIAILCGGVKKKSGCPFKQKSVPVSKAGRVKLTTLFNGRKLRTGTTLEIRVTKPGLIGKDFVFTMRRGALPTRKTLCLTPGARAGAAC